MAMNGGDEWNFFSEFSFLPTSQIEPLSRICKFTRCFRSFVDPWMGSHGSKLSEIANFNLADWVVCAVCIWFYQHTLMLETTISPCFDVWVLQMNMQWKSTRKLYPIMRINYQNSLIENLKIVKNMTMYFLFFYKLPKSIYLSWIYLETSCPEMS